MPVILFTFAFMFVWFPIGFDWLKDLPLSVNIWGSQKDYESSVQQTIEHQHRLAEQSRRYLFPLAGVFFVAGVIFTIAINL